MAYHSFKLNPQSMIRCLCHAANAARETAECYDREGDGETAEVYRQQAQALRLDLKRWRARLGPSQCEDASLRRN